jgi:hypothetical protein
MKSNKIMIKIEKIKIVKIKNRIKLINPKKIIKLKKIQYEK